MADRRIVILTDGRTNPVNAKTAACVVRYKPEEVVALLDTTQAGKTAGELLGVGGSIADCREAGRCAGCEHAAHRHRAERRQAAAGVAKDSARSDRSRDESRFRAARFSVERSGDCRGGGQARRRDLRRAQEQRARRLQSAQSARRLFADSYGRAGLLGRQDAGLGRARDRASRRAGTMRSSSPRARRAS